MGLGPGDGCSADGCSQLAAVLHGDCWRLELRGKCSRHREGCHAAEQQKEALAKADASRVVLPSNLLQQPLDLADREEWKGRPQGGVQGQPEAKQHYFKKQSCSLLEGAAS